VPSCGPALPGTSKQNFEARFLLTSKQKFEAIFEAILSRYSVVHQREIRILFENQIDKGVFFT